jgi:hypothetical protein
VKQPAWESAADTGKFMRACGRSVCYPETVIASRVNAAEQNLGIPNCESVWMESVRICVADIGKLMRADSSPVRHPESDVAVCVDAAKQNLAVEGCEFRCYEATHSAKDPARVGTSYANEFVSPASRTVGHPQPSIAGRVSALEYCKMDRHLSLQQLKCLVAACLAKINRREPGQTRPYLVI